jgi:hypothetical protein
MDRLILICVMGGDRFIAGYESLGSSSLSGLGSSLRLSEFLLMGLLLGHSGIECAVGVVGLVDIEGGVEEGGPETEGEAEDEEMVGPGVFEDLAEESPAALDEWLGVPA